MIQQAQRILRSSSEGIEAYIDSRLRDMYGAEAGRDWLRSQRPTDRVELVEAAERARKESSCWRVERRKTSGSTGVPFRFVRDRRMTAWMDAAMWAVYAWHGIGPGHRQARFWGMPVARSGRWRQRATDLLQWRRRYGAFELSPENSKKFYRDMLNFEPAYAYGYPSAIHEFVDHCERQGLEGAELGIGVVITTGEPLSPAVRENIERFFACRVVNEYGCTEAGILAIECESGGMHRIPVAAFAEVTDSTRERSGGLSSGEVLVTDLYGRIFPLLRYRLHDVARRDTNTCACGRDLELWNIEAGRVDSFIETPDGKVYDAVLAYTVPDGVLQFRAYQRARDLLEVEVVPRRGHDFEDLARQCRTRWSEALGGNVQIDVFQVSSIQPAPSGKLRYFVPLDEA